VWAYRDTRISSGCTLAPPDEHDQTFSYGATARTGETVAKVFG